MPRGISLLQLQHEQKFFALPQDIGKNGGLLY
jgi:hypothetical protein